MNLTSKQLVTVGKLLTAFYATDCDCDLEDHDVTSGQLEELKGLLAENSATQLVDQERARQQFKKPQGEGWTPEHDDQHFRGELGLAAVCYHDMALEQDDAEGKRLEMLNDRHWPWDDTWFKPFFDVVASGERQIDRQRCLVKAGALVEAELERLERFRQDILHKLEAEILRTES